MKINVADCPPPSPSGGGGSCAPLVATRFEVVAVHFEAVEATRLS